MSNIIIQNNIIGPGATSVTYGYDSMIKLSNCSCIVTQNQLIRGSTNIAAYIAASGTSNQIITDNFFDSTTINGSSTILVSGLTRGSIYERNKNQTSQMIIPLDQDSAQINSGVTSVADIFISNGPNNTNFRLEIIDNNISGVLRGITFITNLSSVLPDGVKVLNLQIGNGLGSMAPTPQFNNLALVSLGVSCSDGYDGYNGISHILDVNNLGNIPTVFTSTTYDGYANTALLRAASQTITLDTSSFPWLVNSSIATINAQLAINYYTPISILGNIDWLFSPIVVTYRW